MYLAEGIDGGGHSIGITSLQEDTFTETIDDYPGVFSRTEKWGDLLRNDLLAIEVTAYHLSSLQGELPKTGRVYREWSREELLAYGYNAGKDRMLAVVGGSAPIPSAAEYTSEVALYMDEANSLYCESAAWRCSY